jgi:hypothetical protein
LYFVGLEAEPAQPPVQERAHLVAKNFRHNRFKHIPMIFEKRMASSHRGKLRMQPLYYLEQILLIHNDDAGRLLDIRLNYLAVNSLESFVHLNHFGVPYI